jgi:hypothetical protein
VNREIVVGFVKDHEEACLYEGMSRTLRVRGDRSFRQNLNRDCLLLITRMREARKTLDAGLALAPSSTPEFYRPCSAAGFPLFLQSRGAESESLAGIFEEAHA